MSDVLRQVGGIQYHSPVKNWIGPRVLKRTQWHRRQYWAVHNGGKNLFNLGVASGYEGIARDGCRSEMFHAVVVVCVETSWDYHIYSAFATGAGFQQIKRATETAL
jgi:hypothetical protein